MGMDGNGWHLKNGVNNDLDDLSMACHGLCIRMSKTLVMYLPISPHAFPRAALAGHHRHIVHIVHDPGGVDSYRPKELKSIESLQATVELQSQFSGTADSFHTSRKKNLKYSC